MIFSITDLLEDASSSQWITQYFHPQGFGCPYCKRGIEHGRVFRHSKRGLVDYRCKHCDRVYNLYSGTVLVGCGLSARQAVLLIRGVCKGESSAILAEELGVCRSTVHLLRQKVQANGYTMLAKGTLPDMDTETDEMFQNAGEKRATTRRPRRSTPAARQQTQRTRRL
jgi:transposase-like protein